MVLIQEKIREKTKFYTGRFICLIKIKYHQHIRNKLKKLNLRDNKYYLNSVKSKIQKSIEEGIP